VSDFKILVRPSMSPSTHVSTQSFARPSRVPLIILFFSFLSHCELTVFHEYYSFPAAAFWCTHIICTSHRLFPRRYLNTDIDTDIDIDIDIDIDTDIDTDPDIGT